MNYVIKQEKIIFPNKIVKIFACNEACILCKTQTIACTRVLTVIQLFHEKNVIAANRWHVRSRRSICCNPIIGTHIVEPAFDVYICRWVCKMNLSMARLFSAKRKMSRLIIEHSPIWHYYTRMLKTPRYKKKYCFNKN